MTSFAKRYLSGEHRKVWTELQALGPQVFEDNVHDDALEVARETMCRARRNIETLVGRLGELGYQFADSGSAAEEYLRGQDELDAMTSQCMSLIANSPHSTGRNMDAVFERIQAMRSRSGPLVETARTEARAAALASPRSPLEDPQVFSPAKKSAPNDIARLERELGGRIPLSLRAWYEQIGSVSLLGSHPLLNPSRQRTDEPQSIADALARKAPMPATRGPGESLHDWYSRMNRGYQEVTDRPAKRSQTGESVLADPLVVFSIEDLLNQLGDHENDGTHKAELALAPDDLHKADISADAYYIRLPLPEADFGFGDWHNANFVDYLRTVFEWGGFPGLARSAIAPRAEISKLTQDLLPF